jgi:hypothetical protein
LHCVITLGFRQSSVAVVVIVVFKLIKNGIRKPRKEKSQLKAMQKVIYRLT